MNRALLVIDVQNEYFTGKIPVTYPAGSISNIAKTIDEANKKGIPVFIIQHTNTYDGAESFLKGTQSWEVHPEVISRPHKYLLEKHAPGSFTGTELDRLLKDEKVDTVVITGYMTQMCCDTTARQAFHTGYKVEFLSDATGTLAFANNAGSVSAEQLHNAILVTQASVFSKVMSTKEWISQL